MPAANTKPSILLNMFEVQNLYHQTLSIWLAIFLIAIIFYFIAPTVAFERSSYVVNENEVLEPALNLSGLIAIDITVAVLAKEGSATGKH